MPSRFFPLRAALAITADTYIAKGEEYNPLVRFITDITQDRINLFDTFRVAGDYIGTLYPAIKTDSHIVRLTRSIFGFSIQKIFKENAEAEWIKYVSYASGYPESLEFWPLKEGPPRTPVMDVDYYSAIPTRAMQSNIVMPVISPAISGVRAINLKDR